MSEYQYYEFLAIDRPLDAGEMAELRAVSSRAYITATGFVNHYDWGDLKAAPLDWMERYFDASLYLANWGTQEFMLRFPRRVLGLDTVAPYCGGDAAFAEVRGDAVILGFTSEEEPGDDWDDGSGWLSSLIPLRADIAGGDHRALYLAWLLCAERGEFGDDATEPPVPPGLGKLTAPLEAFADFLRIDGDLIAVAAERSLDASDEANSVQDQDLEPWLAALPEADKTGYLVRLAAGDGLHLRAELLQRYGRERQIPEAGAAPGARSIAALLAAAKARAAERQRRAAEAEARERARREREEAERRARYLDQLAAREAETWREVDALVAAKLPSDYDRAVRLLGDLRDLGAREGRTAEVAARIGALQGRHARKSSFLRRLEEAGLAQTVP